MKKSGIGSGSLYNGSCLWLGQDIITPNKSYREAFRGFFNKFMLVPDLVLCEKLILEIDLLHIIKSIRMKMSQDYFIYSFSIISTNTDLTSRIYIIGHAFSLWNSDQSQFQAVSLIFKVVPNKMSLMFFILPSFEKTSLLPSRLNPGPT